MRGLMARLVTVYWLPVLVYAGVIFGFSSTSHPEDLLPISVWDKALHLLEYAGLGLLCHRALANAAPAAIMRRALPVAIIAATLYGVSDELHQMFVPLREADLLDLCADGLGAGLGACLWAVLPSFGRYSSRLMAS